jgi:hypothetical protein
MKSVTMWRGPCSKCHCTSLLAEQGGMCERCVERVKNTPPKPPAVWWIMLLMAWPFGGALHAQRLIEAHRLALELWTHKRKAEIDAEAELKAVHEMKEHNSRAAADRERIEEAFDGIIDDE